ncbi:MAG: YihY/virulence factor BrkB family protein [Acidobacteria bacterium]|nr:YihY/virulence factor BrkB family protein [Acidobacteriota bacterium]
MAETTKLEPGKETAPITPPPPPRGLSYYVRGSWVFFKKMWPAIYDLTTTETYVNASAIAFNMLLSFFSFVVLVGSFMLHVMNWQRGYETFYLLLRSIVPRESATLFWSLNNVTKGPGGKATLLSFGLLIFSSMGIFQPMEKALNRAWGFKERGIIKQYLVYLLLVLVCGLIIMFPISLGSVYDFMLEAAFGESEVRKIVFKIIGPIISLPFIVLLFFAIYYIVPHGKVHANQVFFTSVAMAVLWVIATLVFRLALPLFDFEESYNRLASLMALVTWIFITAFILILGANLTVREVLPRAWTGLLPFRLSKKKEDPEEIEGG